MKFTPCCIIEYRTVFFDINDDYSWLRVVYACNVAILTEYHHTSPHLKIAEIRSRIEPDLKENATRILASCGLNVSDAVRLFLRQ
jgi:hypothetical protein